LRHYASGALDINTIENRILDILKGFDKVPSHKVGRKICLISEEEEET